MNKTNGTPTTDKRMIIDLCAGSGSWSKPYADDPRYQVITVDINNGQDVRLLRKPAYKVHGILAAPPCTDFAVSGAQYWKAKDDGGATLASLSIVDACLRIIYACNPVWWALENPVGRLKDWIGPPVMYFDPCDYGDPYTKKTVLWGNFTVPKKTPVEPIKVCSQGSWIQKLGGKSERTKRLRSITPPGFALAFKGANP